MAAVVEREASGKAIVRDYTDQIALIAKPHGLVGRLIDGLNGTDASVAIAARIPAGSTGLMAEVGEYTVEAIDVPMGQLGGTVFRQSTDDVKAELKAADDARRAAEKEAARADREKRRMEREREWAEWHNKHVARDQQRLDRREPALEGQKMPVPPQSGCAAQQSGSAPAADR
jgi:hypothetical protein